MKRHTKPKRRRGQKRRSSRSARKFVAPGSIEDYNALSKADQQHWDDIGQITTEVRLGVSLNRASRKYRRDPRTVQRLAKTALRKRRNGRWSAKRTDSLLRVLQRLTPEGITEVALSDSRQATVLGKYWNAVDLYRNTGDSFQLQEFDGRHIVDAGGNRFPLLTDLRTLDRLGSAGVLSFETLYARAA